MNNISQKIYSLRIKYNLTQEQLAKIAGVSNKAISAWELGTRDPKIKSIQNICAHFGIDINSFIDEKINVYEEKPTPVSESEVSEPVIAQIMNIVRQLSPETQVRCLEYF